MSIFIDTYESLFGFKRTCQIEILTLNEDHDGVPVIIAPGFLTQDSEDWKDFIASKIDAPIIYVKWQSSSILRMSLSTLTSIVMPAIGLLKTASYVVSIFSAWTTAAKEANLAGQELARFINTMWHDEDKAIFIGHSLGVRVITEAMRNLDHDNVLTSISIAGAINKDDYDARISSIRTLRNITHSNLFSTNDAILTWLYRIGEFNFVKLPIGLVTSSLENVRNYRSTTGHTEYHERIAFSNKLIQLYQEAIDSYNESQKTLG